MSALLSEEVTVSPRLSYSRHSRNRPLRKRPSMPDSVPLRMRRESWLAKYSARESWRPVAFPPTGLAMRFVSRG